MAYSRLKFVPIAAAVAVAVLLVLVGREHFHESHSHDHEGAAELSLNEGRKWETDEPLRTGMLRIHALMRPTVGAPAQGMDAGRAKAIASGVRREVAYLIDNCKLAPKADAVLHVLIADLQEGAEALEKEVSSSRGIALIGRALERYPEYFEHPDWPGPGGKSSHSAM